ncbi:MAG: glycosyltransferase family 4 protein [Bacteroidota bacterium]
MTAPFLLKLVFQRIFKHIDIFLPMSSWCSQSLISDFLVGRERINVAYSPIDLSEWRPAEAKPRGKPRLLFVGNDFKRKGGPFLLDLFRGYLAEECTLTIISNDTGLSGNSPGVGIETIRGIDHCNVDVLREIYRKSDLFVFPTRRDQFPQVIGEAMASGLGVVASDVGGINELVQDGRNGFVMPYGSDAESWAERIKYLVRDRGILEEYGRESRRLAEEKLSLERFGLLLEHVVDRLKARAVVKGGRGMGGKYNDTGT